MSEPLSAGRILVTGGAGFLGAWITRCLARKIAFYRQRRNG
jgi:nucleoside-diphosphate-sugar epimerase